MRVRCCFCSTCSWRVRRRSISSSSGDVFPYMTCSMLSRAAASPSAWPYAASSPSLMSVVSVVEVSSSRSVSVAPSCEESPDAWDERRALPAAPRCRGGRAVVVGLVRGGGTAAVSMGSLQIVAEGLGVWLISA
jgi:hypothetical protein